MLKDRVILLTGGSKGLGKATAFQLASKGARLTLIARGKKDLDKTVSETEMQAPFW